MSHDNATEQTGGHAGDALSSTPARRLADSLTTARTALRDAADLDLAGVDVASLGAALDDMVRLERTAAAVKARVIAAADRAGLAGQSGAVDTIAVLKDRASMSGRDAKRAVELGRLLHRMPDTAAALADGQLGVAQAEQLARAVKKGRLGSAHDIEASLLDTALTSTPEQLADDIKRREIDADGDRLLTDEQYARSRRSLHTWREGGLHRGSWTADPVSGEYIESMIRALTTFDDKDTPEELRRSPEQRRLDGLVDAAKLVLGTGEAPTVGGEKPHVSVIVTAESLGGDEDAPPAELTWAGHLSRQALGRILCDATLTRILADADSQVLDVGRATRVWGGSQRRAIVAMTALTEIPQSCSSKFPTW